MSQSSQQESATALSSQQGSSTAQSHSSQQESSTAQTSTGSPEDDWTSVTDPNERRKIQNRIAQRKFREKARQQREESERAAENQRRAGAAYTTPDPEEIEDTHDEGLPWGGISMRHVFEAGRSKEQGSRESSINAAVSKAGGSSRLGLHLIDQYARGNPAWAAWGGRFGGPAAMLTISQRMPWSQAPG